MVKAVTLARWESRLRPLLTKLPPKQVVKLYSEKRLDFLARLAAERSPEAYVPPKELERILWGIKFRGPLMNAAGMFKNGECYPLVANEGAAAYLGGTGPFNRRKGNKNSFQGLHLGPVFSPLQVNENGNREFDRIFQLLAEHPEDKHIH